MELISLESNRQKLDGGSMFGNAPKALWERWAKSDDKNRIDLATRCLLVKNEDGSNILFEAGLGAFFDPILKERYGVVEQEHMLLKNLKNIGLEHEDIDAIVLSHLHFDHAGGLLSEYGDEPIRLLFPNAKYYVGKRHWERALNPLMREKASFIPVLMQMLENSDRLVLVNDDGKTDLPIPVTFHFSDGHTIGLMISEIALPKTPLVFVSDLAPGVPWVHLPISMGYDRFAELITNEKQELFEALLQKNAALFFTHDPKTACAKLDRDDKGKFFCIPVDIETLN